MPLSSRSRRAILLLFIYPILPAGSNLRLAPKTSTTSRTAPILPRITSSPSIPGCDLSCQECLQAISQPGVCETFCEVSSCWSPDPSLYSFCTCSGYGDCLSTYVNNPYSFSAFNDWIRSECPGTITYGGSYYPGDGDGDNAATIPACASDCVAFQTLEFYSGGYDHCTSSALTSYQSQLSKSPSQTEVQTEWFPSDGSWVPTVYTRRVDLENIFSVDCDCYYFSTCSSYCTASTDSSLFSFWRAEACSTFQVPFWFHPSPMPATVVNALISRSSGYTSFSPTNTKAIPTDVVGYFTAVASGVPTCVESVSSVCPALYAAATDCWSSATSQKCFCSNITETSCTEICNHGEDPEAYGKWVTSACAQSSDASNGTNETATDGLQYTAWIDNSYFHDLAQQHLIPWNWTVTYNSQDDHRRPPNQKPGSCPSTFSKLAAFALINILVLSCTLLLFRRTVVYAVTFHKCGKPGSPMWLLTGTLSATLLVISNWVNATIVHSTSGYSSVPVAQLMLLWCTRPRISWVAVLLMWVQKEESMYFAVGASALVSEGILQLFSAVYLGQTVSFAAKNGYYLRSSAVSEVPNGHGAVMMYAGALIWEISVGAAILQIIWSFLGVGKIIKSLFNKTAAVPRQAIDQAGNRIRQKYMIKFSQHALKIVAYIQGLGLAVSKRSQIEYSAVVPGRDDAAIAFAPVGRLGYGAQGVSNRLRRSDWQKHLHDMGLSIESVRRMQLVVLWMIPPFLGQWLFWVGFVKLYGDRYCPPKMNVLTVIWSLFATSGVYTASSL